MEAELAQEAAWVVTAVAVARGRRQQGTVNRAMR